MRCPTCDADLVIAERQGIEIDYCRQCRGVWLDRGELDKIIERSYDGPRRSRDHDDDDDDDKPSFPGLGRRGGYSTKPKKRESFLSELFDFG